ncbi:MAG TPA: redoxin domain-containing protein [Trueperaceae bacterium]
MREKPESYPRRLKELEPQFSALESQLEDTPQKEALSVLHGILHGLWRNLQVGLSPLDSRSLPLQDVPGLYQHAPKMEGAAISQPLPVGEVAPDFALPDASGSLVRLSDFRGQKALLVFYPLDWSPGCSQQLDLYQRERNALTSRGVQLLAVSVDSIYSHGAWAAVRGIEFPLLADFQPKGRVSTTDGVYREPDGFSDRALCLIDADGVIRFSRVSPQLHHLPDICEPYRVLDGLEQPKAA